MCNRRYALGISILFLVPAFQLAASEADALAISAKIQARFLPFGTILEPIYASPTSDQIIDYTDCGDSALWTGAYLAAEAFRYNVTQAADALNNVRSALAGLKALSDVTGDNRLARCMVPANSPYAASIASQESSNTINQSPSWIWVGNTSRDEVVGAFFGLGAAFDLVNDSSVRSDISDLATRLLGYIADHDWSPNDDITNTFLVRPEELHMLLVVASHVNPSNKVSGPLLVPPLDIGVDIDVLSNSSYFKFNLDFMSFYNLVRLGLLDGLDHLVDVDAMEHVIEHVARDSDDRDADHNTKPVQDLLLAQKRDRPAYCFQRLDLELRSRWRKRSNERRQLKPS